MWLAKLLEPKKEIDDKHKIFSNKMLLALIVPLLLEQFFVLLVGITDTLMISYAGEDAVSGVSLDNMFIAIFIFIFSSLASGGSVIVSQYIGNKEIEKGENAAGKLIGIAAMVSVFSMMLVLLFKNIILNFLFSKVTPEVMEACVTYLEITAYSLPAIAIMNGGAAIFRSMGNTKPVMKISILSNIINVIGNSIGIFVLHAGVAGVAWPSLIARYFSMVVILFMCFNEKNIITLKFKEIFAIDGEMAKRILNIAIPNSFEGGIFQAAKVALSSITALFGTTQIAANGIAQSFWSMSALVGSGMGAAYITVIGQCMGAKDTKASEYYMVKLTKISYLFAVVWNILIVVFAPFLIELYALSDETKDLIFFLIIIHCFFCALVAPISMPFANGLRAAGDIKYTVVVGIFSTVGVRVILSIVFAIGFNLGVVGIAFAMVSDWMVRAVLYYRRYKSGKWKYFRLI